MGLEVATVISELFKTYPLSGDDVNRGDDHIRLIKKVLQLAFPGELGGGFNTPILATETELNYLQGLSSNAQDQFDAIGLRLDDLEGAMTAPLDTVLSFFNAAAPDGWTQLATHPDAMMRVVSGAGAGYKDDGHSPTAHDHVHATVDHALTEAQMPAHNHQVTVHNVAWYKDPGNPWWIESGDSYSLKNTTQYDTTTDGSGEAHNHGNTEAYSWAPNYVDMILAIKV